MRACALSYAFFHAALLGACSFRPGASADGGEPGMGSALPDAPLTDAPSDAAIDAPRPIDAIDASLLGTCFGTAPTQICLLVPPTAPLPLSSNVTVNTDSGSDCEPAANVTQPDDGSLCVVAGTDVMISGALTGSGSRPLVLLSTGDIAVSGSIDVGSHIGRRPGPAADPAACGAKPDGDRGAGGGGGSFGGVGGAGGGGTAVTATPVTPTTLRGGCAGGSVNNGGGGGAGGGAVALIASGTITVSGQIDASGAAGGGSRQFQDFGGGGGGAGGMIVLDAATLAGSGAIFAAGGGGGEASSGVAGNNGSEPAANNLANGAPGGSGGTQNGGDGGHGSTSTSSTGAGGGGGASGAGGGGGGGGAGVIVIHAGTNTSTGARSPGS